jgi:hypothetical protein
MQGNVSSSEKKFLLHVDFFVPDRAEKETAARTLRWPPTYGWFFRSAILEKNNTFSIVNICPSEIP